MRSHEERIAEVRRRIAEKERQKRRKQRRIVAITCIAACLAVIFGASFVMPGISGQMVPGSPPDMKRRQRSLAVALHRIYHNRAAFISSRRMRDDPVFSCPSVGQRRAGRAEGGPRQWN